MANKTTIQRYNDTGTILKMDVIIPYIRTIAFHFNGARSGAKGVNVLLSLFVLHCFHPAMLAHVGDHRHKKENGCHCAEGSGEIIVVIIQAVNGGLV